MQVIVTRLLESPKGKSCEDDLNEFLFGLDSVKSFGAASLNISPENAEKTWSVKSVAGIWPKPEIFKLSRGCPTVHAFQS